MLSWYYELRGWDQNGIPRKKTLEDLGLREVSGEIGTTIKHRAIRNEI